MSEDNAILAPGSLREIFEEAVSAAVETSSVTPMEETTAYLIDVLCYFAFQPPAIGQPMTEMFAAADHGSADRRVDRLKCVGDQALYVAGYFQPSLARQCLDVEYFHAIGGRAYQRLSRLLRSGGGLNDGSVSALTDVYEQLSSDFEEFTGLLSEVREHTEPPTDDVAKLYDAWLESGSETVKSRLVVAGMALGPKTSAIN